MLRIATARIVHAAPSRTGPSSNGVITAQETTRFTSSSWSLSLLRPAPRSNQMMSAAIKSAAITAIVIHSVTGESKACRNPNNRSRVARFISLTLQGHSNSLQPANDCHDAPGDNYPKREYWNLPVARARNDGTGDRGDRDRGHALLLCHWPAKFLMRTGDFSLRSQIREENGEDSCDKTEHRIRTRGVTKTNESRSVAHPTGNFVEQFAERRRDITQNR